MRSVPASVIPAQSLFISHPSRDIPSCPKVLDSGSTFLWKAFITRSVMAIIVGMFAGLNAAAAQDVDESGAVSAVKVSGLRQIYVPADDPAHWPQGDWVPIAREELRDLLRRPQRTDPTSAYLEHVVYRARYSGTSFVGGTLEALARLRGRSPRFVDLGQPSLVLTNLHWPSGEAVWGLAGDHRSLLRVERDQQTLSGRWSLSGRRVFSTVEFDLVVPPATVTQLEFDLPAGRALSVEGGLISEVLPSEKSGWRTWSIDLGRATSCRLSVSSAGTATGKSPRELQASQVATYSFVDDGLRIQTDVTIQSISGNYETLELTVPGPMTFSSVTIGNETVLPSSRREEQQRSILSIDVRRVTLAAGNRIRLRGRLPLRPGSRQGLPRLGLRGARWLQVRRQVRVVSPLQLKDIDATDSLLVNSSMGLDSGAALEFDDLTTSSRVRVTVDTPQPELSATVLNRVDWNQADALLEASIRYTAQTGSTYVLECDVPADWEVTRVESDSAMPVAQWQSTWDADEGRNRLHVELRNALSPQTPVQINVLARPVVATPRAVGNGDAVEVPVVMPLVSGERTVTVVVAPASGVRFAPSEESDYRAIELADLVAERPDLGEEFTDVGHSELLVLQATDPGEHQFLSTRVVENERTVEFLTSDDSTTAGEGAQEQSLVRDEHLVRGAPLRCAMEVFTLVAVERGGLCRNRAVLHVPPQKTPRTLVLQMPDTARLLSAESPFPTHITGRKIAVEMQSTTVPTKVSLTYESPLTQSLLSSQAAIPLPEWEGEATTIGWQIEMPRGYRLRDPTDGTTALAPQELGWSQRILGPLGRSSGEHLFWPFTASSWQRLVEGSPAVDSQVDDYQVLHRSLAGASVALTLSFWNVAAACRLGWVVLLFSLLLTSWPFQQERLIRRSWTLKMILVGTAAALLSPELLAIPWGGFVVGAALGTLLPDRWRSPRTRPVRRERSQLSTKVVLPLSATMGVLLVGFLIDPGACRGWQSPQAAGSAATSAEQMPAVPRSLDVLIPLDVDAPSPGELPAYLYIDRAAARGLLGSGLAPSPSYLLRSADYDVHEFDGPSPSLSARFEVLLLRSALETRVVLGLTGVHFPDANMCQVDGVPAMLLPRRGGDGVVVVVPPVAETQDHDGEIAQVQITMECEARQSTLDEGPKLDVTIPEIIDSRATFRSGDSPSIRTVHSGAVTSPTADGQWRVALGGQGHLIAQPSASEPLQRWLKPIEAASVVEAHPMRLRIESRLNFQLQPQWSGLDGRTLRLQLPDHSIVRSVHAEGLQRTQSNATGRNPVLLDLSFSDETAPNLSVDLSYDLPTSGLVDETGVTIPALPFLVETSKTAFPVHLMGVAAAPGFQLTTADPEGMMPTATGIDESRLPPWRGARSSGTAQATYQLSSPRALKIPLSAIAPAVSASVRQTLTVKASMVEWEARVELNVRDAAVALHRLRIDPRVNVRQATVTQESVERLASWSRTTPEQLILFLKEELSGQQTILLKGSLSAEDRQDFVIPHLSMESASLTEPAEVVVQQAPDVDVVVAADDGTVIATDPPTDAGDESVRHLATLNLDPTLPPLRIQSDRGEIAAKIEQVTVIESMDANDAVWSRQVRFNTSRLQPQTISVQVSSTPGSVQFAASVPMTESSGDEGTTLTLDLADLESDFVEVTIFGRTPLSKGELSGGTLPEVRVDDAPLRQQWVVVLEGAGVDVENPGEAVDVKDLPEWISAALIERQQPFDRVVQVDNSPVLLLPGFDSGADARLTRLDSAVWQQRDGRRLGVTVADVMTRRETDAAFALPAGMKLRSVNVGDEELLPESTDSFTVRLPASETIQRMILWWTDESTSARGLCLPAPVDLSGSTADVVLFGNDQQIYEFGGQTELRDVAVMLEEASSSNASTASISPIARALRNAGVSVSDSKVAAGPTAGTVHAIRLDGGLQAVPVQLLDRQLVRVIGLIVAAGAVLLVWFVLGRWSERLGAVATSASGLPALVSLAAIIWLFGKSGLGLALLLVLCGLWLIQTRRDVDPSDTESQLSVAR